MKEMATIQDLASYKEVFAKWESQLCALYCKTSPLAMFFGWFNVGKKGIHEASAQLQSQQIGRQNKAAFTPEALPSDDFQSQVRQPLWDHFGFGSLPLVAVYLCLNFLTIYTGKSPQAQSINPHPRVKDFAERVSVLQREWIWSALYIQVKHNHKFMEGLGKYAMVQGNPALRVGDVAVKPPHPIVFCHQTSAQ